MNILVGLGNPDKKYNNTRHNVGFTLLDELGKEKGLNWREEKKFKSLVVKDSALLLVKPQTYMNKSGEAVKEILSYYDLIPKKFTFISKDSDLSEILTVVHDDLDIDLGSYKVSIDSRSAGHNGVQSIINHIKTQKFKRIRIGINSDRGNIPADKFVLQKFNSEETKIVKKTTEEIIKENLK